MTSVSYHMQMTSDLEVELTEIWTHPRFLRDALMVPIWKSNVASFSNFLPAVHSPGRVTTLVFYHRSIIKWFAMYFSPPNIKPIVISSQITKFLNYCINCQVIFILTVQTFSKGAQLNSMPLCYLNSLTVYGTIYII